MDAPANLPVEFGNAGDLFTDGTGWFVGFSDWAKSGASGEGLRYLPKEQRSHTLCMKWMFHPKGDGRGEGKPISEGRTLSILVADGGLFRLQFASRRDFPSGGTLEHRLSRLGDFVVWGPGVYHRWFVDADCLILTLRWTPE